MTRILLIAGISLLALASSAKAADHLLTATAAGGLQSSAPFTTNKAGHSGDLAPGQGSPLSGEDNSTPATDQPNNGVGTDLKPVADLKTAPSANSVH